MLTTKLARIKELIEEKERIDGELSELLGELEKSPRGRPRKKRNSDQVEAETETGPAGEV
jgi:hypothetical protein